MASTNVLERVASALINDDDELLRQIYHDLSNKIKTASAIVSNRELHRDFDVETYIPKYAKDGKKPKACIALRSETSGNCLYSSVSLALVGDNSLIADLRAMTSIELYLKAEFYCEHPYFLAAHAKHGEVCHSVKNVLLLSVSFRALDCGLSGHHLVKQEAILNCHDQVWSSFLCILAVASVTNRNIFSYYPDFGDERFNLLFNGKIEPCPPLRASSDLHILFCFKGIVKAGDNFQSNHFVPLIYRDGAAGEKRKLQTVSSNLKQHEPKKNCMGASMHPGAVTSSNSKVQSKLSFSLISCPASASVIVGGQSETGGEKATLTPSTNNSGFPFSVSSMSTCDKDKVNLPSTSTITAPQILPPRNEYDVAYYREKVRDMSNEQIGDLIKIVFRPE